MAVYFDDDGRPVSFPTTLVEGVNTDSDGRLRVLKNLAESTWDITSMRRFKDLDIVDWTPQLIETTAWYDAAETDSLIEALGAVSQWSDKSGNGNHMSQESGAAQPTTGIRTINSLNALSFDGTDDYLRNLSDLLGSGGYSVFCVAEVDNHTVARTMFATSDNTTNVRFEGRLYIGTDDTYRYAFRNTTYTDTVSTTLISNNTPYLLSAIRISTSNRQLWLNGVNEDSDTTTVAHYAYNETAIGALPYVTPAGFFDGKIGEVIIIQSAVSTSDRQKIEGYLAHKWGLTASLPVGHPYKTSKPQAVVSQWTPSKITTEAWYDAAEPATVVESSGAVSQWSDRSGNNYHLLQPSATLQPKSNVKTLNGKTVIDFDGVSVSGDYMLAEYAALGNVINGLGKDYFIVSVYQGDGANGDIFESVRIRGPWGGALYPYASLEDAVIGINTRSSAWFRDGVNTAWALANHGGDLGYHIQCAGSDGTTLRQFRDGSAAGTASAAAVNCAGASMLAVAKGDPINAASDGSIAEILILDAYPTDDVREKIEGYLAHKWGLQSNLAIGHRYRFAAPVVIA